MSTRAKPAFTGRRARFIALCLLPGVVFVLLFTYYPMVRGAIIAFQRYNLFDLTSTPFVGLENFQAVLAEDRFWTALRNTGTWVVVSLFFQFVLGFGLALLLRRHFRGRGLYQAWVFFPWAMSGFLIGLLWRWMFNGAVRRDQRPAAQGRDHRRAHRLPRLTRLGDDLGDRGQRLVRRDVLRHHDHGRAAVGAP